MSEGLLLFTPLDASADLRAETVSAPISPLDEVRVFRPGTEGEGAEGETGELAARGPYTIAATLMRQTETARPSPPRASTVQATSYGHAGTRAR
jgi:non-ribosomal peptide synthetase component E (peptide arylation enzyme)